MATKNLCVIVTAQDAATLKYDGLVAKYPNADLFISGVVGNPLEPGQAVAIHFLITQHMAESEALAALKQTYGANVHRCPQQRCYWWPINDFKEAVRSHTDELSQALEVQAVHGFGLKKLMTSIIGQLPAHYEAIGQPEVATEMRKTIFKAKLGFK